MRLSLLLASWLLAVASSVGADTIPNCGNTKCTFPPGSATDYFCDRVCTGGTCDASAETDHCPGHCLNTPWVACINNTPCSGTGNVCKGSGTVAGRCVAGNVGQLCSVNEHCSEDHVSPCPNCCDVNANASFLGDGVVGICGADSASTPDVITGTPGNDVICARKGDDTVNAGDGDDRIDGGPGNDTIDGGRGNDIIYGGDDNDMLTGGPLDSNSDISGDDVIFGGNGNDCIIGNGGRDYLDGGPGDDDIATTTVTGFGGMPAPDDNVGSLLCGGDGDDLIWATGARHQCIDGGAGQRGTNSVMCPNNIALTPGLDCTYEFILGNSRSPDGVSDIGTVRNCKGGVNLFGTLFESPSHASCGCD